MKNIFITILILSCFNLFGQSVSVESVLAKKNFKKALSTIEVTNDMYFNKFLDQKYYTHIAAYDGFDGFDNNIYVKVVLNGENLTLSLYKYYSQGKVFKQLSEYDTGELAFEHLDGDVYGSKSKSEDFVLYSKEKGLYFHLRQIMNYSRTAYENAGGVYKKTMDETSTPEDEKNKSENYSTYKALHKKALQDYKKRKKEEAVIAIQNKPDEGVTNPFQKSNVGKILFSNGPTDANKMNAATYKSSYLISEPVSAVFFLDKGLTKYINTKPDEIKENLWDSGKLKYSEFKYKITFDNGKSVTKDIKVENSGAISKTSGVFNIVGDRKNNSNDETNYWLTSVLPFQVKDKTHEVKVELISLDGEVIAEGKYTYKVSPTAKFQYGVDCVSKGTSDKVMASIKPDLKSMLTYQFDSYNKKQKKLYKLVDFYIMDDKWSTVVSEYGIENTTISVKIYFRDEKGNPFYFYDNYEKFGDTGGSGAGTSGIFLGLMDNKMDALPCDF